MENNKTEALAKKIRIHAVKMVNKGRSSHIGSVLSIADILAVLYGDVLRYIPDNPKWPQRDRFILSKGHAGAGVYAALAESAFFPISELMTHYQNGSIFSGHISHKGIPGIEFSTGSLGHGLPVCCGMAYAAKIEKKHHKIYCLMGDGELGEGSNWEAIMFAAHHGLNNLTVIIDRNRLQSMKSTEETLRLEPLSEKFTAFGWAVNEIDGHDHDEIKNVIKMKESRKPCVVIANTIKGKGVSYMENSVEWHYRTPLDDNYKKALTELGELL
jgi:transketolase